MRLSGGEASVAMVAFGHGCGQARGRARKEGGKNKGGRGVSRRGDSEEVEPPARSRRWRPPSARVRLCLCLLAEGRRRACPCGLGRQVA